MKQSLPKPKKGAIIYENIFLYVALANFPITKGHTVIVWKKNVQDLHLLSSKEFLYLMKIVDQVRDALLSVLGIEKVYLLYMDEVKHVHWHLIPRYNSKGYNIFEHNPVENNDFSLASYIRIAFDKKCST